MVNFMNYDTRLNDIREILEINQKEIANSLNVSRQNYSFWETGYKFIPLKHLNEFCNIYDVSMDYVLKISKVNHNYNKINTIDRKLVGKRLKEIRIINKITQVDLADFLNTTHSTISAYEAGKTLILTSFAYQICTKYNISMDYLCGRKNNIDI